MATLAPVVLFVYCRKDLTGQLLEALERNRYVKHTQLYIFADIPNKPSLQPLSQEVIKYVSQYAKTSRFESVHIQIARRHKGLAASVIEGVSQVMQKHGKAIVLEDDLMISDNFLEFMQKALSFYEKNPNIWSVTGNTEYLPALSDYPHTVYMSRRGNSWGWGTWKDRWNQVDWKVSDYDKFCRNPVKRYLFDRAGNEMSAMLESQMKDRQFDSWAIRWCYQQFKLKMLTVYPAETRVINCGNDKMSTHGSYHSSMALKDAYRPVQFENLRVERRLQREQKRVYSRTATPRQQDAANVPKQ